MSTELPKALVIRAAGTNCDVEVCRGFELAGAAAETVHLDTLIRTPALLDSADLIAFPGGFSYGDDVASGRIFAMKLKERLWPALKNAVARGVPMIGICNGFQALVQVGLLPGPLGNETWTDQPPQQRLSLQQNVGGRYVCRWVGMHYEPQSVCLWTKGMSSMFDAATNDDLQMLPVGHGEGRITPLDETIIPKLESAGQVVVRYKDNYNGSALAVAGVCDSTGLIFGLMPHPDRYLAWTRHPHWTRLPKEAQHGDTPGLKMFRNAVNHVNSVAAIS